MVVSRAVASGQAWAWVTSALVEHAVEKAVVLAGSLRRVKTAGKLVVITSPHVPEKFRLLLYNHFDLVYMMDNGTPTSEDQAKAFAFSLSLFQGCVYLSPNSVVVKKCDDIITTCSRPGFFVALTNEALGSSSMFTFVPSIGHFHSLRKILKSMKTETKGVTNDGFLCCISEYAENNSLELDVIDNRYYHQVQISEGKLFAGFASDLAIINFGLIDPRGAFTQSNSTCMGLMESYGIDLWWNIYHTEVYRKSLPSAPILSANNSYNNDPIAIIGISCRLPGANNLDEFWQLLVDGREGIAQLPTHRWQKGHTITPANQRCRNTNGGFLDFPIDKFDAKFFNLSPKEAEFIDPQQRLLHEISWEALEDAAIDPLSLRGEHVGVFVGSWIHDYRDLAVKTADRDFFRIYMGNSLAATAARLSFLYGITGPSIATESGCSSAIASVDLAVKSLRAGETNLAFAAGVNLFLHPFDQTTMSFVLAPDGRCKTFDETADGFGRAEGVGALILKRMSDAIADGDKIYALIRGSAVTQEGVSKSLGTPTIYCESLAMELALEDAKVQAKDVSFVEAHGTATSVGDPMEISAIAKVYSKNRTEPLYIGSVKTNVGHTESVSGITGIIKVLLSMQNETIPPHLNLKTINPALNLEAIPAKIPLTCVPWQRLSNKARIAGVSSFGISGLDGHVIIEEAPNTSGASIIDLKLQRPYHIMKVSAKSPEALDQLLTSYEELLEKQLPNDKNSLSDIAYTANVGRATFNHRAVILAKDVGEAVKAIKTSSYKRREVHGGMEANVCFLFTGQGSQYKNMARELYLTSPVFRLAFDKCDRLLETRYDMNICPVMWDIQHSNKPASTVPTNNGILDRTLYSQVAIFVVEYCLLKLWESWGIRPAFALGHSLGEFAAAVCAGILSLESALELVVERSKLIESLPQGKMLVLKIGQLETEQLLQTFEKADGHSSTLGLEYAAINSPEQTVLAGDSTLIKRFADFCTEKQVKCIVLAATHAFHSRHMDPILEKYREIVDKVIQQEKRNKPVHVNNHCQFISGMEGKLIDTEAVLSTDYWVRHTREKVNFVEASNVAFQEGCNLFLEIGPNPVLSAFIMGNNNGAEVICLHSLRKNQNDWITMLDSLGKLFLSDFNNISIDWKGFDQFYNRVKVSLPFYPFQRKKVWVDFRTTPAHVHPLVGQVVPNASKSTIFESEITLKKQPFLNDHAIGNSVIFPGAAFLEMCVVAGHCAVQGLFDEFTKPRRAIMLKGLRIEAPLALQDGKVCRLQTVIDLKESEKDGEEAFGYSVKIFNWFQDSNRDLNDLEAEGTSFNGAGQWKSHASACFLPLVTEESRPSMLQVNIAEIKAKWEMISAAKDLYDKLPEVGLRFGPNFQSLVCGWKCEKGEKEGILLEVKVPIDAHETYLAHPVVLDAMLQASMLWTNKDRIHKKLYVPIHIKEFIWLSPDNGDSTERYVFCTTIKGENHVEQTNTLLLDGMGQVLATMNGVEFFETTARLVESMIQQQSSAMPQLWEEVWKAKKGPLHGKAPPAKISEFSDTSVSADIMETCSKLNQMEEQERRTYRHLDDLTLFYFLNALYKLGWEPKLEEEISLKEFMLHFKIIDVAWNFMKYFLNELMIYDGTVQVLVNERDRFIFKIVKLPRSKEVIETLCKQTVSAEEANRGDYRIISECGKCLTDFLTGNASPLNTLFPEDPSKPSMGNFYDTIRPWVSKTGEILNNALTCYNHLYYTKDTKDSVIFRVLEVGSGTGSGTKDYLEFLTSKQVNFEYTFSDISSAFLLNAQLRFENFRNQMQFRKLNLEEDAISQGFIPEYYDLIIACEVIHATRDIRETLKNLRVLLKTNGHIQITETTKPDRRITLLVGLLEGYWRMTDFDLRPHHATLSGEKWVQVLTETGYHLANSIGCYMDVHSYIFAFASEEYSIEHGKLSVFGNEGGSKYSWLIFCDGSGLSREIQRRLKCLNRKVVVLDWNTHYYRKNHFDSDLGKKNIFKTIKELEGDTFEGIIFLWALTPDANDDQEQISLPFIHMIQGFLDLHKVTARLYVMTRGAFIGLDDSECPNFAASTVWGIAKTLRNEQPDISVHCIDLSLDKAMEEEINDIFYELFWTRDEQELLAFRGRDGKRIVPRLASLKITDDSLSLPPFSDRFQLMLPSTKAISDLEFGHLNNYTLKEDEIEVRVKCCALNFRDIFAVLKPTAQFDSINSIGSDFAGVITRVGSSVTRWKVMDPVLGINTSQQALPSHLKTNEEMVIRVPDSLTFEESSTICAVYATALYCLVKVAKINSSDTVLVHTASGGVGLSAIQICKHFGAEVIATAGSQRKRAYLRSLGIKHVFHSRNTAYGDEILKVTGGRGVNVVLNSLTGPGFIEASIKACAEQARFVEMSKLNIWTTEQVHEIRQDISYTVADLTSLEEQEWKQLMEEMKDYIKQDFVRPIPYTRFDAVNIRQALQYLQKAKHIGKVVCVMPESRTQIKDVQQSKSPKTYLFNDRSTYLITGGLGGIGLEVAKFMLNSGAKHLILVSRSAPKPEVEALLKSWKESGKQVEAWQVDVGDYHQVSEMTERIKTSGWPPLRGIMHAAGVLSDGTIPNQTWEKFQTTYNAKVKGTLNLHNCTKHLQLEHFVLFSSVTSLFGSPGQCNHTASNAFEDAFAHYRFSVGLPATSINFANWGEVGVATEIDFPGIRPITTNQGLQSVEAVLRSNRLQSCVMNVDSFGMVVKLFPKVKGYLDDKRLLGDVKAPTLIINTDQFWGEVDGCEGRETKIDVFKRYIKNMLRNTLKMEPDETIDDNAEFQGLGVDSLMLLEMKNYLQNLFGNRLMLTAAHLKDCNNAVTLATRLVDMLDGKKKQDAENEDAETGASEIDSSDKVRNETPIHAKLELPTIVG